MLGAASCDLVEDLVVVDKAGDTKFTFDVNEAAGTQAFSRIKKVDMSVPADQKSLIKEAKINSITVRVPSFTGTESQILSDLELFYVATGATDTLRVGTIADIDLYLLNKEERIAFVAFDDKARDDMKLKEILAADGSVTFKLVGKNNSKKAIKTRLEFTVNATVTAQPLAKN